GIGLDHEASRLIATATFKNAIGETDIVETGSEAIAVMTASVTPADDAEKERAIGILTGVINNAIRQDITNILALELSKKHDLTLNLGPVQQLLVGNNQ
ncbi:hypothetical protein N8835_04005, partial [Alphaproteobacteria bacterium]|nr:hypothetical protein [Alphaproteobacteria bacterium]